MQVNQRLRKVAAIKNIVHVLFRLVLVASRGPFVVAHSYSCCRAQAVACVGSAVVASGLSCPAACGILVP